MEISMLLEGGSNLDNWKSSVSCTYRLEIACLYFLNKPSKSSQNGQRHSPTSMVCIFAQFHCANSPVVLSKSPCPEP